MANEESEKKPKDQPTELTDKDLGGVVGGAVDAFLQLDGIKGESDASSNARRVR